WAIYAVVFQEEVWKPEDFSQPASVNQRSRPGCSTNGCFAVQWKQLSVTPERFVTRFDNPSSEFSRDSFVVVFDLERAKTLLAPGDQSFGVGGSAFAAFESLYKTHRYSPPVLRRPGDLAPNRLSGSAVERWERHA